MRRAVAAVAVTAALALAGAASAHVTLQPSEAPAGGFTRLDVRVPNERDNAGTTKVEVKFPHGFVFASTEPVPGWTARITKRKLAKPVEVEGEKMTEEVDTIAWTGDGRTGIVRPGEFQDFGLSLAMPDKPGAKLTFKALQTYSNGEVVRWIGPPDAEEPAPQVTLTAAKAAEPDGDGEGENEGAPVWLTIVALALGALGLGAGVAALRRS
ncbi:MAG: hypothetical protein QOE69_3413 [Thermoleophilaceae bacterium]|jgi:uncharacterized protein|nr:hypothetical protein [Thermoleophilaceae bacterium]